MMSVVGFRRSFRLSRKDKKTNKSMYECKKSAIYDTADVPTYEEVTKYQRQDRAKHRLVILVGESCVGGNSNVQTGGHSWSITGRWTTACLPSAGPTGVGLNELKRKLFISDPEHFSVTIPRKLTFVFCRWSFKWPKHFHPDIQCSLGTKMFVDNLEEK